MKVELLGSKELIKVEDQGNVGDGRETLWAKENRRSN